MFKIVDNMVSATAFPNERLFKTAVEHINGKPNDSNFSGKFKLIKEKDNFFFQAINHNNEIIGYIRLNQNINSSNNIVIDGEFTEKEETIISTKIDNLPKLIGCDKR